MTQNPPANSYAASQRDSQSSPDRAPDDDAMMKPEQPSGMEIPVPLSSVAMPGEDDKMQSPEQGDPVQFQVEGKISRIEGDTAFVAVESVNGKPVDEMAAKTKSTPEDMGKGEDAEFAQLRSEAQQQGMY